WFSAGFLLVFWANWSSGSARAEEWPKKRHTVNGLCTCSCTSNCTAIAKQRVLWYLSTSTLAFCVGQLVPVLLHLEHRRKQGKEQPQRQQQPQHNEGVAEL
ncbi:hypothetical protein M5D96_012892, partial [Drosophila gunungcola]